MNSFISNSSSYKIKIFLFIALTAATYLALNLSGFTLEYAKNKNSNEALGNNVSGKNALMRNIFAGNNNPDIVFIGSSTTKYHVSTNLFKSNNVKVFNYGLESHFFTAYPTMIDNAIKLKPKIIAITIDGTELYNSMLSLDAAFNKDVNITSENLLFFIKHFLNNPRSIAEARLVARLTKVYLQQINYFSIRGYKISNDILNKYNQFDSALAAKTKEKLDEQPILAANKQYIDCDYMGLTKIGFGCKNGDGVLLGNEATISFEKYNTKSDFPDKRYDYVFASIMNSLFDKIRAANIKPVIVLLPQFSNPGLNEELIRKTLHADSIDMTHFPVPKDGWFNSNHLNAKGRYLYSVQLVKNVKPLINIA